MYCGIFYQRLAHGILIIGIMMISHLDIIDGQPYALCAMRTTLTIDDDIFAAVRSIANTRSTSIGSVLSELVRKGLQSGNQLQSRNGFPVFAVSADSKPITPEDVRRAEDET